MNKANEGRILIGLAWYRRDQWARLRAASVNVEDLDYTYDEWLRDAEKTFRELETSGKAIQKVHVDVEHLIAWCKKRGLELDGKARTRYVSEKVRQQAESPAEHRNRLDTD
jgi:hypothetical protein